MMGLSLFGSLYTGLHPSRRQRERDSAAGLEEAGWHVVATVGAGALGACKKVQISVLQHKELNSTNSQWAWKATETSGNTLVSTWCGLSRGQLTWPMGLTHGNYGVTDLVVWSYYICGHLLWKEVKIAQSCPTLCDPMDYTAHGILQARILEWVAIRFSRGHLPNPGVKPR